MPASVYTEMNQNTGLAEDNCAYQLAFELSMLELNSDDEPPPNGLTPSQFEDRKKSANMTECVPVPSSEHVAEIVGRQGCKIKALRAKTNTYIKTPVRGEEPVFVVTGRKEDVCSAKREILSAAEHFSQIRASRRNSGVSNGSTGTPGTTSFAPGPPSPTTPGQITIQVRVPYRVVGLVVGPKGATIKRIQQQTHTYIVTPSRDKEPVFEVTGLPGNVEKARQEIESHIALRTGGNVDQITDNDFLMNGIDSGFHEMNGEFMGFKTATNSAFSSYGNSLNSNNNILSRQNQDNNIFSFPSLNGTTKLNEYNSVSNGVSSINGFIYDKDEGISSPSFDPVAVPSSIWSDFPDTKCNNRSSLVSLLGSSTSVVPRRSSSFCGDGGSLGLSPPLTDNGFGSSDGSISAITSGDHQHVRRIHSDPLNNVFANLTNGSSQNGGYGSTSPTSDVDASPSSSTTTDHSDSSDTVMNGIGRSKNCIMCSDGEIVAALVPCGHNMFCMNCANDLLSKTPCNRHCPVCQQTPTQAIRIFS